MNSCKIVSSWPQDTGIGSGVANVARSLAKVVVGKGFRTEFVSADFPSTGYLSTSVRRILFNFTLGRKIANGGPLITFDFDGFALPHEYRYVSVNEGILADIVQFEAGPVRGMVRAMARLEQRAVRGAEMVFVPSRFAADKVKALYGVEDRRITLMPNGIFFDEWASLVRDGERERIGDVPTVLCVARLYRRKGVDLLLRAWPAVMARSPDAVLKVVGGGLELARLRKLAGRLGVDRSVVFEGDVTSREYLALLYARCTLFCLPSLHETFGIAFLEAMAAGKPVVGIDATAVPEVVRNGMDGLLVRPDTGELAAAILSLLNDPTLCGKMGQAGRERASSEFRWEKVSEPIVDYLRRW